jgi:hypothetical protein
MISTYEPSFALMRFLSEVDYNPKDDIKLTTLIAKIIDLSSILCCTVIDSGRKVVLDIISGKSTHPCFYKIKENFDIIQRQVADFEDQETILPIFNCLTNIRSDMVDRIYHLAKRILGDNFVPVSSHFRYTGITCLNDICKDLYSSCQSIVPETTFNQMESILGGLIENKYTIKIEGNKRFKAKILRCFTKILSYRNGFDFVKLLIENKTPIKIIESDTISAETQYKPFLIRINPDEKYYYYFLINGKKYCYFSPIELGFLHELVHAYHATDNFKKAKSIFDKNPLFDEEHSDNWKNTEEAATIGMDGDKDPFTENNIAGDRGFFPWRFGQLSFNNLDNLNNYEKIINFIKRKLDGELEYFLTVNSKLLDELTNIEKFNILEFAKLTKNKDLEKLLNCPQSLEAAIFEDLKIYFEQENIDEITQLIKTYPNKFNYHMFATMENSPLFDSFPMIKEFIDRLNQQFPPL